MSYNKYFDSDAANKLWDDYFLKVEKHLTKLPYAQGSAVRKELESHVFEATQVNSAATEIERLAQSLKDLGDPAEVVPPMVASALIDIAQRSNNPFDVIRAASYQIGRRFIITLRSILIGLMALASVVLILVAITKPFLFDNVGLFTNELGALSFGIIVETENLQEHLGISVIPIALIISFVLYKLSLVILRSIR